MNNQMKIRPATADDSAAIFELVNQLHLSMSVAIDDFQTTFDLVLQRPENTCLVAILNDSAVGYVSGYYHPVLISGGNVAFVDEIAIRSDLRGKGIGTALMSEFEKWAKAQFCGLVGLATRGARPFYEQLGYESGAGYYKKKLSLDGASTV